MDQKSGAIRPVLLVRDPVCIVLARSLRGVINATAIIVLYQSFHGQDIRDCLLLLHVEDDNLHVLLDLINIELHALHSIVVQIAASGWIARNRLCSRLLPCHLGNDVALLDLDTLSFDNCDSKFTMEAVIEAGYLSSLKPRLRLLQSLVIC